MWEISALLSEGIPTRLIESKWSAGEQLRVLANQLTFAELIVRNLPADNDEVTAPGRGLQTA